MGRLGGNRFLDKSRGLLSQPARTVVLTVLLGHCDIDVRTNGLRFVRGVPAALDPLVSSSLLWERLAPFQGRAKVWRPAARRRVPYPRPWAATTRVIDKWRPAKRSQGGADLAAGSRRTWGNEFQHVAAAAHSQRAGFKAARPRAPTPRVVVHGPWAMTCLRALRPGG